MKKLASVTAVIAIGLSGPAVSPAMAAEGTATSASAGTIAWSPCPENDPNLGPMLKGLECGEVEVPLDYTDPDGEKIALALTRAKHTVADAQYKGVVLLHRGQWPGPISRDMPTRYAKGTTGLAPDVSAAYDWIGFDPRGVGASEPSLVCDPAYINPTLPAPVPKTAAAEQSSVARAQAYADSCGDKYGDVLDHFTTADSARDLDRMRVALGQEKINYYGIDWGGYLGSVYATMYPTRVKRMVLDSVPSPSGVGYQNQMAKSLTSEHNAELFFAWVAKYDSVYHLGTTAGAVEAKYYQALESLRTAPVDGTIGPGEWTNVFEQVVYRSWTWTSRAKILSDFVVNGDATALRADSPTPGFPQQNRIATTNAVNCTDGPWPKSWNVWSATLAGQYAAGNHLVTWSNGWYSAPCAFWPAQAKTAAPVGNSSADILLVQPQYDGAHGMFGALDMRVRFPNSRLIVELGGHNVGSALSANNNACLNTHVSDYLRDGTRPTSWWGIDATCQAPADPVPPTA
ncbi:alpha/beta fold hydrolase [Streptomyces sp. NPDC013181]|uniref:alpha/beta fold hydrolase n=1 Tax=Streptomyces sp. NPDC013181 TaxID=3364864 RepID=UPI0036B5F9A1